MGLLALYDYLTVLECLNLRILNNLFYDQHVFRTCAANKILEFMQNKN